MSLKVDYKTEFAQVDKNTFINQSESDVTSTFHGKQIFLSVIDNGYFFWKVREFVLHS